MNITLSGEELAEYKKALRVYETALHQWSNKLLHSDHYILAQLISERGINFPPETKEAVLGRVRAETDAFIAANPKPKMPELLPNI